MKKSLFLVLIGGGIIYWYACSSVQNGGTATSRPNDHKVIEVSPATTLAEMLARVPGVYVENMGARTNVLIRGGTPLFVLDGIRLGHSYEAAASAVNVNNITAIEVLKDPTETLLYGRDGQNGVVVIHTGFYNQDGN